MKHLAIDAVVAILCLAAGCSLDTPPVSISIPTGTLVFATVVTSREHSCALTAAGAAYCWGVNASGEIGDSTTVDRNLPTAVLDGLTFTTIAAGRSTTCGLVADGSAYCWGLNATGQYGDGTTTTRMVPSPAAIGHKFTSLVFSDPTQMPLYEVCGLETTGAVSCWGHGNQSPLAVAAGFSFLSLSGGIGGTFCGIVSGGDAYCWGNNFFGEMGNGSKSLEFTTTPSKVVGGLSFASIVVGFGHTCGITTDAHLFCWGDDEFAQLGDGQFNLFSLVPIPVAATAQFNMVASGYDGTCAISTPGGAYCWGLSTFGNLGVGLASDGYIRFPAPVAGTTPFAIVSKGLYNTCGVTTTHVTYCWGRGGAGLGIGNDGNKLQAAFTPTKVGLQPPL